MKRYRLLVRFKISSSVSALILAARSSVSSRCRSSKRVELSARRSRTVCSNKRIWKNRHNILKLKRKAQSRYLEILRNLGPVLSGSTLRKVQLFWGTLFCQEQHKILAPFMLCVLPSNGLLFRRVCHIRLSVFTVNLTRISSRGLGLNRIAKLSMTANCGLNELCEELNCLVRKFNSLDFDSLLG